MESFDALKEKYERALSRRGPLLAAVDQGTTDAVRLVHSDADGLNGITVDWLGPVLLVETHIADAAIDTVLALLRAHHGLEVPIFVKEKRSGDIDARNGRQVSGAPWEGPIHVMEEGLVFELHLTGTPHTGLFLDSRAVRRYVRETATGKRVLNLFSYTGGFGMAAARGAARSTTNVDAKRSALLAAKRNYQLSGLPMDSRTFLKSDAPGFLKKCRKNRRQFDLVILDPPPVSKRTNRDILDTGSAFSRLVAQCLAVVSEGGTLVAGLNNRWVDEQGFSDMLSEGLSQAGRRAVGQIRIPADIDFPPGSRRPTARFEALEKIR